MRERVGDGWVVGGVKKKLKSALKTRISGQTKLLAGRN